jgi:hypothetical protein
VVCIPNTCPPLNPTFSLSFFHQYKRPRGSRGESLPRAVGRSGGLRQRTGVGYGASCRCGRHIGYLKHENCPPWRCAGWVSTASSRRSMGVIGLCWLIHGGEGVVQTLLQLLQMEGCEFEYDDTAHVHGVRMRRASCLYMTIMCAVCYYLASFCPNSDRHHRLNRSFSSVSELCLF